MTLLIDHRNDPPMGEMGIAGTVTNYCVTIKNTKTIKIEKRADCKNKKGIAPYQRETMSKSVQA